MLAEGGAGRSNCVPSLAFDVDPWSDCLRPPVSISRASIDVVRILVFLLEQKFRKQQIRAWPIQAATYHSALALRRAVIHPFLLSVPDKASQTEKLLLSIDLEYGPGLNFFSLHFNYK